MRVYLFNTLKTTNYEKDSTDTMLRQCPEVGNLDFWFNALK